MVRTAWLKSRMDLMDLMDLMKRYEDRSIIQEIIEAVIIS